MVKFSIMFKGAKAPIRSTPQSAGVDIYIPEFTKELKTLFNSLNPNPQTMCFISDDERIINIHPNGRVKIPTGLRVEFEPDTALIAWDKSGVSWENRVTTSAGLIDVDYQGQLFITVFNYANIRTQLMFGQKVVQLIQVPILMNEWKEIPDNEIHVAPTVRGAGGFGSTGV